MSDTSYQTAPAAAPSPPPQEVTIPDQTTPGSSGEVGAQTPSKSPEQVAAERAVARRDAIEKAYAKAKGDAEKRATDKGAEKGDQSVAEKQGKTPGEERGKLQAKPPQNRGDGGRFVSTQPAAQDQQAGQPAEQAARPQHAPLADDAPYRDAPRRFSEAAQADWHGTPESVRGATQQAFDQYERGIQQYRAAAEAFQPLAQWHQRAQQQGTDINTLLTNYSGMEGRLRSDPFGGYELITHNLDLKHPDGRRVTFGDIAAAYLNTTPDQRRISQQNNNTQAQHHQINQLSQTVQGLAVGFQQMQYQQRFAATRSAIDRFADQHPGFDQRSDLIKQELDHGYPLDVAYKRAMLLRPGNGATHAAQTRNTSAQTRDEMDRSISGAPSNGSLASRRAPPPSGSNREALNKAMRRVKSGV